MTIKRTQIFDWHKKNGTVVEFAGWEMPVRYSSILDETNAVRNAVGIFDVSHMGRMLLEGKDAFKLLNAIVPRNLAKVKPNKAAYSYVLDEFAHFKDDVIFVNLDADKYAFVWNAGNYEKILNWIVNLAGIIRMISPESDLQLQDITANSSMFAVQGPKAEPTLLKLIDRWPGRWGAIYSEIEGTRCLITGTGYTGELGCEVTVLDTSVERPEPALKVWNAILRTGEEFDIKACGLGARDLLRMEAGLVLYGNDIDATINPVEASLCFRPFAHLKKPTFFFGKDKLLKYAQNDPSKKRVAIIAKKRGRRPDHGMRVFKDGNQIGIVTSGSFSPLIENRGFGMAYVQFAYSTTGTQLEVEIKPGKFIEVEVSSFPIYDPKVYGWKRE